MPNISILIIGFQAFHQKQSLKKMHSRMYEGHPNDSIKICQPYDRLITEIIVLAFLYLIKTIFPTKLMCVF